MPPNAVTAEELRGAYLFSTLDDRQLQRVLDFTRRITLTDGQVLFQSGDEAKRFYLVGSGRIKLSRLSIQGQEKVIELVGPGGTFAEALMFFDRPHYPVNASAIGATELISIDTRGFLGLLRESVDTCFRLMGDMSTRLHRLIKEIDDLTLQSATERVAGFLAGLHDQGDADDGGIIRLDAPKGVLASRLSVTPETFSRILHRFTEQGLVKVSGGRVEILDPKRLRSCAASAMNCGGSLGPA